MSSVHMIHIGMEPYSLGPHDFVTHAVTGQPGWLCQNLYCIIVVLQASRQRLAEPVSLTPHTSPAYHRELNARHATAHETLVRAEDEPTQAAGGRRCSAKCGTAAGRHRAARSSFSGPPCCALHRRSRWAVAGGGPSALGGPASQASEACVRTADEGQVAADPSLVAEQGLIRLASNAERPLVAGPVHWGSPGSVAADS